MTEALSSETIEVAADPLALYELSLQQGWGDGLPLIPPTEERVLELLSGTSYPADHVVMEKLPPNGGQATVERIVINAAMAGCAPEQIPFVIAGLEAICKPEFNLEHISVTTAHSHPVMFVNGPSRDRVGFDYSYGCLGGSTGRGSRTVGRGISLCMRNIGGQKAGLTSKSAFGQPARFGLCFAEWEERSPWPSFAEQRGFSKNDDVIHAYSGQGTVPLLHHKTPMNSRELIAFLARSIAYPAENHMFHWSAGISQSVIAINPLWAERFGRAFPNISDLKEYLWENAYQPIDIWPKSVRHLWESRVDSEGRVRMHERPEQFVVLVCGGPVDLHGVFMPCHVVKNVLTSQKVAS